MSKNILIIEICPDSVRAGLFSLKGAETPSFFNIPFSSKGALREALSKALSSVRQGAAQGHAEKAYLSIHPALLSLRVLEVPFEDRRKIGEVAPFELSGAVAGEIDEMVVDGIPLAGGKSLAVAVEAKALREYLEALKALGVDPVWIGSAVLTLPDLIRELYGPSGTKAVIGKDYVAVSVDGRPAFVNAFDGIDVLKLNIEYLRAEGISIDEVYTAGQATGLEALIHGAPILGELDLPGGYPPEGAPLYALYRLIKKGLIAETANLRKGAFEYTRERIELRRRLRLTAALVSVIIAVLFVDLYVRYSWTKRSLEAYRNAIRASYGALFPGEKAATDELYSLEAKLKSLDREREALAGGVSPLKVMNSISKASKPGLGIRITELRIGEGRVQARGEAGSFDSANTFKDSLLEDGLFKEALLSDLKSRREGAEFIMTLVLR